ncbi:MAG: nicotinate-nucleotide--dimethylbenzimidazole phosphoribosyltransferase [Oscillospiraceae bacterium]|nr:nicotinate-nucleotide--dimethylbenzimidazole phosphoribosyltransferase [Oscillospiraceae bacterium]
MNLEETAKAIQPLDKAAMEQASRRWDGIAKPLHSLGLLERAVIRIAGMQRTAKVALSPRALLIFCADNGVVAQGVTQTDQSVTALVAENFTKGQTSACVMAKKAGVDLFPVDIGIAQEKKIPGLLQEKIRPGTADLTQGPAMSRAEAVWAVEAGIRLSRQLSRQGYRAIATGEMGIGNTTTSAAVAAVLLGRDPAQVTGIGAGLSHEGLIRKVEAIRKGIAVNRPDPADALDVLAKVGGLDLAGIAGTFLGGASAGVPVVIDGFISAAAALIAARICPASAAYMLASHVSAEPAGQLLLDALGQQAILHAQMCLGEGTGAVALFPVLDMGIAVYEQMQSFVEIEMEPYVDFQKEETPCSRL